MAMSKRFKYIFEAWKAIGRIIAGLALLSFKTVFWALRACMLAECVWAAAKLVLDFRPGMLVGLPFAIIGVLFVLCTRALVKPGSSSSGMLITGGTFAVVRHPMYSGWALTAAGVALIAQSWPVSVLAALQIIIMLSVSCAEDEENTEVFGAAYFEYSRRVWLTGIIIGCIRCIIRHKGGQQQDAWGI